MVLVQDQQARLSRTTRNLEKIPGGGNFFKFCKYLIREEALAIHSFCENIASGDAFQMSALQTHHQQVNEK